MSAPAPEHEEAYTFPRTILSFPVELKPGPDFEAADLSTWPEIDGRLEYVDGRLLYMPPCGGTQQEVAFDVAGVLYTWIEAHPGFKVGTNEAGMKLGADVRAAEAAIWRRADVGPTTDGLRMVPPVLAVEVAGRDEGERLLRRKADWYLARGVLVVWLVLPKRREVVVVEPSGDRQFHPGESLPEHPELPGLSPRVDEFFRQIDG